MFYLKLFNYIKLPLTLFSFIIACYKFYYSSYANYGFNNYWLYKKALNSLKSTYSKKNYKFYFYYFSIASTILD